MPKTDSGTVKRTVTMICAACGRKIGSSWKLIPRSDALVEEIKTQYYCMECTRKQVEQRRKEVADGH